MFVRGRLILLVGALLPVSFMLQGCLVVVWVGAVGVDLTRNSSIEFEPFEHSWLAPTEQWRQSGSFTSIAVAPFPGEARMAERWTAVLAEATDLHVVGPSEVTKQVDPGAIATLKLVDSAAGEEEIAAAVRIGTATQVKSVLVGRIVEERAETSLGGLKERHAKRLYLYLISADGILMWKDELPFTLVEGAKDLDEPGVRNALMTHVVAHAQELRLLAYGLPFKHSVTDAWEGDLMTMRRGP